MPYRHRTSSSYKLLRGNKAVSDAIQRYERKQKHGRQSPSTAKPRAKPAIKTGLIIKPRLEGGVVDISTLPRVKSHENGYVKMWFQDNDMKYVVSLVDAPQDSNQEIRISTPQDRFVILASKTKNLTEADVRRALRNAMSTRSHTAIEQVTESPKLAQLPSPPPIKTNSIPDANAEPSFTHFKKYGTVGVQSYEVSEQDYVDRQLEKERTRLTANIKGYEQELAKIKDSRKKKQIDDFQMYIAISQKRLATLSTPEGKASHEHSYKNNYVELVKEAIKHGEPVPNEVIEQRPEFQVAKNSRQRYEKGLHTSFANKSAAVNAVMFHEKGYKVKRQDGKQILPSQISEIDRGINEVQEATGSTKDIMYKSDLTIAHTSGTFPFLGKQGGLYHPAEKTITTGVEIDFFGKKIPMRSLAHEWGHWLDHEAGAETRNGYEFYTTGKSSRRIKSFKEGLSNSERYSNPLFYKAESSMNAPRIVRHLQNPSELGHEMTDEEKQQAKELTARIGYYYRDPREIWARLTEQYVAEHHGKETIAAEKPEYYEKHPAYWNKETFNEMKPMIQTEIERRTSIVRGT
jgi:hypothetical protein